MYNVGDKVVIRSWREVAKERGQEKGKIYCEAHCVYDFSMRDYAGESAVIEEVQEYENTGEYWYRLVSESGELYPYHWTDSMLVRRESEPKVRHLIVSYPPRNYKPKYELPILCRARDMGKVIYGKWIVGGNQRPNPNEEPMSKDELSIYIAYKLVPGAKVLCNFKLELDARSIFEAPEEEPEFEVSLSGFKYMKMPKGQEA